jgi:hypothetical protein
VAQNSDLGCATVFVVINGLLTGLVSMSFGARPYSSWEQELFYRYGSMAFLIFGAILPGVVLFVYGRRIAWAAKASVVWMFFVMLGFFSYIFNSGGGV